LLSSATYKNKIEWPNVFFFFGDERYVPSDQPNSNFRMALKALFEPLQIPLEQIFAVDTTLSPEASADGYEQIIRRHFKGQRCRFDLVLLGLGDNSHTASLFPHSSVLHETKAGIKSVYVHEVKMNRITFTAPLINEARTVAFLVYGPDKAEAVRHVLQGPLEFEEYPAQLIRPVEGEVHWFLDQAAERLIKNQHGPEKERN
jgi:6-phosphogluconolactonase